ncbi:MAG: hypothetical protein QG646_510 [Euryarchaeota archaeon]|nr:hypothetical protein [Euryarchaeota archaeon]
MSKIYISDLDGTLLQNNATLSDFAIDTLIRLLTEDLNFTIATARSVISVQQILKYLPLKLPIIEFNGAFISDFETGRHEIINDISGDIKEEIFEHILQYNLTPFISSFNGNEDCLHYEQVINEGMEWYLKSRTSGNDKRLRKSVLRKTLAENVVCFIVVDKLDNLLELTNLLQEKYTKHIEVHLIENQYSPGWYWLTIHDCKATKDQAISIILKKYGLRLNDLTVFGDNANDVKMFKLSRHSIAVSNAKPELKKYATRIIGTNEEDSVVKYIMDKHKGSRP